MLRAYVEQLLNLEDGAFTRIAFMREPLKGRLSWQQLAELEQNSMDYGRQLAEKIYYKYGKKTIEELITPCGGRLQEFHGEPDTDYAMFAYFQEPDIVAINIDNADKSQELIKEHSLHELLGDTPIKQVILAHELYHLLELKEENPFPQQKHVCGMNILGIKLMRKMASLEEIAAMSFARTYLALPCSPYVYNIIMLEAFHPQQAKIVFEDYMSIAVDEVF